VLTLSQNKLLIFGKIGAPVLLKSERFALLSTRNTSSRRNRFWVSLALLSAAGLLALFFAARPQQELTGVAQIIDGDSLRINGVEIRLRGIDAPELMQTCRLSGQSVPCGRTAKTALQRLANTGLVTCIGDERDRYGRILAVCRVRGIDMNAAMVRDGHAVAFGDYVREESAASAAFKGIWEGEFERPRDWRLRHPRQ
jgi:endonuclease YncB( thermonuclease family)